MNVELVYASRDQMHWVPLTVAKGTAIKQAIVISGILQKCPEIDLTVNKVGIFSNIAALNMLLKAGDRIEIYRPLLLDPKQARRLRAEKSKQQDGTNC